jgi:hypothetical protein
MDIQNAHAMIAHHRIDPFFGPVGAIAGKVVLLAGVASAFYSAYALLFAVVGAFVGFSGTGADIDAVRRRVRPTNDWFGLFRSGRWIEVQSAMMLGIGDHRSVYRAYSRGNVPLDVTKRDFRVLLLDADHHVLVTLCVRKTRELAQNELEKLAVTLNLNQHQG